MPLHWQLRPGNIQSVTFSSAAKSRLIHFVVVVVDVVNVVDVVDVVVEDDAKGTVRGRAVGLAELPDGSLLVADDGANVIWRVSWEQD